MQTKEVISCQNGSVLQINNMTLYLRKLAELMTVGSVYIYPAYLLVEKNLHLK